MCGSHPRFRSSGVSCSAGRGSSPTTRSPETARAALGDLDVELVASLDAAVDDAALIVLVTRWDEFRGLPELLRGRADPPLVIDGRRMLAPDTPERYEGIGRGGEAVPIRVASARA